MQHRVLDGEPQSTTDHKTKWSREVYCSQVLEEAQRASRGQTGRSRQGADRVAGPAHTPLLRFQDGGLWGSCGKAGWVNSNKRAGVLVSSTAVLSNGCGETVLTGLLGKPHQGLTFAYDSVGYLGHALAWGGPCQFKASHRSLGQIKWVQRQQYPGVE